MPVEDGIDQRLIAALRAVRPDLRFAGVGGERMAEQGLESLFPMRELALMGLLEVLPELRDTTWLGLSAGSMVMTTSASFAAAVALSARVNPSGRAAVSKPVT